MCLAHTVPPHRWNAEYDCGSGQCNFEQDDEGRTRLVAYAGLFSHALYASPSPLHLYKKVSAHRLRGWGGGRACRERLPLCCFLKRDEGQSGGGEWGRW